MEKNESGTLSYTIYKINSKCIKNLNERSKIIKILVENIDSKFLDISLRDDFFLINTKIKDSKSKNKQGKLYQTKKQRKPSTKGKDKLKWEKIIKYLMLISKIYKEHI